jgi:hypothetical protein
MAKTYNLRLNRPKKKTELTKDAMKQYMLDETPENKLWFYDLMKNNKKKIKNNLTGDIVDSYDLSKVREEFAQRFFPEISDKAKREKKTTSKKLSFEEELEALVAGLK